MKRFLFLFALIFTLGTVNAQITEKSIISISEPIANSSLPVTTATSPVKIGYCEQEIIQALGGAAAGTVQVGIFFPADYLTKYVGNNITKVVIGTPNYAFSNPTIKLYETVEGSEIYSQAITNLTQNNWNEVTLTTPYTITVGKGVFITYQISFAAKQYPIGLSSGPAHANGDYYNAGSGWMHITDIGGNYNISLLAIVEGDNLKQNEITLLNMNTPTLADIHNFSLQGTLKNNGAQALQSFDVEYQIENETPVITSITNINVPNYQNYYFSINDINISSIGEKTIQVKVLNPNGEADDISDNEASFSVSFYDASTNTTSKKVLLEHFTTAQCSNCPWAHTLWKNVLSTRKDVIYVSHHAGYYTDNYTIQPSVDYCWFYYAGGSTYAPASMLDRTNLSAYGASNGSGGNSPGPVFFPDEETLVGSFVDRELALPAFVSVKIERNYNSSERTLNLKIISETIEGMPNISNARLNVFLTEDGLTGTQSGSSNKNYVHDHVLRRVLTPTWGDAISYTDGSFSKNYTYTIPTSWKTGNMKVIAFVSKYNSANPNDCQVYNAESVELEGTYTDISNVKQNTHTSATIREGLLYIYSAAPVQQVELYNIAGQKVLAKKVENNTLAVNQLASGVYIVKVKTADGEQTVKVIK